MEHNKTGKYIKYALGEIVLVVVGILIALQIGNLNEERKKDRQSIIQKKSLKVELENDLEVLELDLEYALKDLEISNSYAKRLARKNSNLDSLVKIVRYDYQGSLNSQIDQLSKTTFNSLKSSGKLDLLEIDLTKKLENYYTRRDGILVAFKTNSKIYFNLLEPFMSKYPGNWFAIQGHLQDVYWKDVDKKELYGEFNALLTVRVFSSNVKKKWIETFIIDTKKLINELR